MFMYIHLCIHGVAFGLPTHLLPIMQQGSAQWIVWDLLGACPLAFLDQYFSLMESCAAYEVCHYFQNISYFVIFTRGDVSMCVWCEMSGCMPMHALDNVRKYSFVWACTAVCACAAVYSLSLCMITTTTCTHDSLAHFGQIYTFQVKCELCHTSVIKTNA